MDDVKGGRKIQALLCSLNQIKQETSPGYRAEDERSDDTPAGNCGDANRSVIKEVNKAHHRNPSSNKNSHEKSQRQIVQALNAYNLSYN